MKSNQSLQDVNINKVQLLDQVPGFWFVSGQVVMMEQSPATSGVGIGTGIGNGTGVCESRRMVNLGVAPGCNETRRQPHITIPE